MSKKVSQRCLIVEKNNCFDGEKRGIFTVVLRTVTYKDVSNVLERWKKIVFQW